mgnify:CR=1 FL=1|jgi:hypothetical protein
MTECKNDNTNCTNLRLRTARKGEFTGKRFFGCYLYPDCLHLIPLHFDGTNMTEEQKELYRVFYLFVRSNMFIDATFGVVYFNLKHAAFLDYLLKTDVVYFADNVEIGFTGAKIYHELFCHLFLIPSLEIKHYLINNFPKTFQNLYVDTVYTIFGIVDDYDTFQVDESKIIEYKDIFSLCNTRENNF